ncbi:MAG: dienelactone hydrolase family protein [Acidimicrobiia bacterium]
MTGSRSVQLAVRGAAVPALVFEPPTDRTAPRPAIVLAAEAYGLNEFTRRVAGELAAEGYVVVVPDYYRGVGLQRPDDYSDFTEVMGFIEELDFTEAVHDVMAAVDHARSMPAVDPDRVAVWGYCTGGTLAMLTAALDARLAAAVWFFPSQPTFPELSDKRPVHAIDLLWNVACPVQLIYGDQDAGLVALAPEIIRRFERYGVEHRVDVYEGAGHAFSAPDPPLRHDAADRASWADATAFAAAHLRP